MRITAMRQQARDPNRASVFIDGKYGLSLTLDDVVRERLKPGLELSEPELRRLQKLSADGKLRQRALEWCLSRPRSRRELTDYLRRKQAPADLSAHLTADFADKGIQSDAAFARWLTDLRRRSGKSERLIRLELIKRGVGSEDITRAMDATDGLADESDRLRQLLAKKRRLPRYQADQRKLIAYCLRRGYGYQAIVEAIAALDDSPPDS